MLCTVCSTTAGGPFRGGAEQDIRDARQVMLASTLTFAKRYSVMIQCEGLPAMRNSPKMDTVAHASGLDDDVLVVLVVGHRLLLRRGHLCATAVAVCLHRHLYMWHSTVPHTECIIILVPLHDASYVLGFAHYNKQHYSNPPSKCNWQLGPAPALVK